MSKTDKAFMVIGAILLSTSAALSAYGFHGLADSLTEADRLSWRWGVQMQTYHSLGLILVALVNTRIGPSRLLSLTSWLFVAGILLFCGSIYAEKLGAPAAIGEVAPIGGSGFMIGWLVFALAVLLAKAKDQ